MIIFRTVTHGWMIGTCCWWVSAMMETNILFQAPTEGWWFSRWSTKYHAQNATKFWLVCPIMNTDPMFHKQFPWLFSELWPPTVVRPTVDGRNWSIGLGAISPKLIVDQAPVGHSGWPFHKRFRLPACYPTNELAELVHWMANIRPVNGSEINPELVIQEFYVSNK